VAALTQTSFDDRASRKFPIGRDLIQSPVQGTGVQTTVSAKFSLNGVVKTLKHNAGNLTTDADFDFVIKDKDGVTIYTESSITDNQRTYTNLTADNSLWFSGDEYTCTWSFTTSQTLAAAFFEVLLTPGVD